MVDALFPGVPLVGYSDRLSTAKEVVMLREMLDKMQAEDPGGWRTWADLLVAAAGDDAIIAKAPDDAVVWEQSFYADYGGDEGAPVLAWSEQWVYFPVVYDGQQYFARAPRHPRADGQRAVGGRDPRR